MILKNGRYSELAESIKKNQYRIVIYGAGMIGQVVVPYFINRFQLHQFVDCYVDVDRRKQGKVVNIGVYKYVIQSPGVLQQIEGDNYVLIITNSKFYEVLGFLDNVQQLDNTEAYIIPLMQVYELQFAEKIGIQKFMQEPIIPKKIHYCWFGDRELPEPLRNCMKTWKTLCPDYEIICWNERNYDVEKIPYTKEAYQQKKYGFVSDVARLDILYQQGGIYMDTDVALLKGLDGLLYQEAFIGVEKWGNINSGGGCGAIPHHPMIKKMLDYRKGISFLLNKSEMNLETNGLYETIPFIECGMRIDNTLQKIAGVTVYPSSVFHPYDYMSCEARIEDVTVSVHHFYGGWMDKSDWKNRNNTQNEYHKILERIKNSRVMRSGSNP